MKNNIIALFEFVREGLEIKVASQKHYRLVPAKEMKPEDILTYQKMSAR